MGRSFHWIAAACEGGRILLFSLRRDVSSSSSLSHIEEEEGDDWEDEEEKPTTSSRPPSKGSKKKKKNNRSSNNNTSSGGGKEEEVPDLPSYYSLSHIHILRDVGTSEVWKVEWNASGNELFAAIDGHVVLKFNCSFNDQVFNLFLICCLIYNFFNKKGMTWTSSTIEDSSPFYLPNLPNNNSGGVNDHMASTNQQQQTFLHGEGSFSIEEKT